MVVEISDGVVRIRASNGVDWCLAIRPYNNAGLVEQDRKKTKAPDWIPYHSIGAIAEVKPEGSSSGAEVWLVCSWRDHEFMLDEGDARRRRIIESFVKFVSTAIGDGALKHDSIWLLDLVEFDGEPSIAMNRKVR